MWATHELSGSWGHGAVTELGACVLSWAPQGRGERLYMASDAVIEPGDMWHGGIPVCAPWFGKGRGDWQIPTPHGVVSRVPWRTELVEQGDDEARVRLVLDATDTAHVAGADRYPDDLRYVLDVTMGRRLVVSLTVQSPTAEVVVDEALHPYFVADPRTATVHGLEGIAFVDYAVGTATDVEDHPISFDGYLDRIYDASRPTELRDGANSLLLDGEATGSVVVWNPGPGGSQVGEGWTGFVCVEYGNVQRNAVTIPAGGSHTMSLVVAPG